MGTNNLDRTDIINALRKAGTTENLLDPVANLLMNHLPEGWANLTEPLRLHFQAKEPHYQKQTKMPEAHQGIVESQIQQWLNLGLIRKADSMFNTPLICIQTKGGHLVVQDFRDLNQKFEKHHLQFKSVQETLGPIEEEYSRFFTTLDLSGPAWQLTLPQEQQEITAFSLPGWGQFLWKVAPLHLGGGCCHFPSTAHEVTAGSPRDHCPCGPDHHPLGRNP